MMILPLAPAAAPSGARHAGSPMDESAAAGASAAEAGTESFAALLAGLLGVTVPPRTPAVAPAPDPSDDDAASAGELSAEDGNNAASTGRPDSSAAPAMELNDASREASTQPLPVGGDRLQPLPAGAPAEAQPQPLPAGDSQIQPLPVGERAEARTQPLPAGLPAEARTQPLPAGDPRIQPLPIGEPGEARIQPLPAGGAHRRPIADRAPGDAHTQPLPAAGGRGVGETARSAQGAAAAARAAATIVSATGRPAPASSAGAAVDPRRVERRMELVDPELRVRVDRVIERMHQEHGHRVEVVETVRHQVRQNHLFEQGRSRPGPVVTWTRNSNHTHGRAVDVIIDGSYGNPAAYLRLGRIATEEGLRTLGPRDPGHLELPRGAGDPDRAAAREAGSSSRWAADVASAPAPRAGSSAAPAVPVPAAAVAEVAAVAAPVPATVAAVAAQPAAVATLAQVATPGGPAARPGRRPADSATPQPAAPQPVESTRPETAVFAAADSARGGTATATTGSAAPVIGAGAAARIAQLLDLQSAAPIRPLQHVVLRIDGPGGEDRIRLGLRGNALGGSIALSDPAAVERLSGRMGELQRALNARGLEAESLRVRSAAMRADTVEISRAAAGLATDAELQRIALRNPSEGAATRDRASHNPPEHRDGAPDHRQGSRREQGKGRNT